MAQYPFLVQTAWDVVETYLRDWQSNPYSWYQEIDIKNDLSNRLQTIYRLIGEDLVSAKCQYMVEGLDEIQKFSRVTCDPYVSYLYSDGKKYYCHPDIVVWDDVTELEKYPDGIGNEWPILWACEIKYPPGKEEDWDQEKLRYLVSQKRAQFGCWLKIYLERAKSGNGIYWEKDKEDSRIWIAEVRLPPIK